MSSKRPLGPPSGNTPNKPPKKSARRRGGTPRKSLVFSGDTSKEETSENTSNTSTSWEDKEISALVQFIALYHEGDVTNVWPFHKQKDFWDRCATAVSQYSGLPQRSGNACRRKVQRHLSTQFKTLDEAEECYHVDYFEGQQLTDFSVSSTPVKSPDANPRVHNVSSCLSPLFHQSSSGVKDQEMPTGCLIKVMTDGFLKMTKLQRVQFLSFLFSMYLCYDIGVESNFVPTDFVKLAGCSFKNLEDAGIGNTLYFMAQSVGKLRSDGTGPRMPLDRMPFGLIHHNLEFFAKENPTNLHPIDHYAEWQTTMFAHFGHKWDRLFRGPMWSYDGETSEEEEVASSTGDPVTCHSDAGMPTVDLLSQAVSETDGLAQLMTGVVDNPPCEDDNPPCEDDNPPCEDDNPPCEDPAPCPEFSMLWSGLSTSERVDLEQASVLPQQIEELHNVRPQKKHKHGKTQRDPMKAKVNVAGLSARQLRRRIQQKGFTRDTNIQIEALKTAKRQNPSGRWWIKADACDMRAGVMESMRHEWSGDVDLGDGQLEALHQRYMALLDFVKGIGLNRRKPFDEIVKDLRQLMGTLQDDAEFLEAGLRKSTETYEKKRKQSNVPESNLFALAWDVTAYETLKSLNVEMSGQCQDIINRCLVPSNQRGNIPSSLSKLRKDLQVYIKDVFSKRREAATHLMVFMIADERRDLKPYAIPVRALPFKSIRDTKVRELRDELKAAMENLGMVVVGFVTDGEFNSLRTQGSQRPVSVIQLIMDAKKEAKSISFRRIERFLTPKRVGDAIEPEEHHPAVPKDDVVHVNSCIEQGMSFERAILSLRRTHFPANYDPHPWKKGLPESKSDCLKSLMATYLFRKKVNDFTAMGVNFKEHLYVPEKNPISGEFFHEREDHNHVLKRITTCAREACITSIGLQFFRDALHDDQTGLTYEALTGKRKQSVPDCEKFFSVGVLKHMQDNKHDGEAKVVETVLNWHKANDGRGLDEDTRKKYNLAMLDWLLEDWMPWYKDCRDFSMIDVNRPIKGIQGLTREIIVALVANLESKEQRRAEGKERGLPPENPRASTTDDVEGIISLFHELLGPIFDHKTFKEQFPKIMNEFNKRIDPDLPFYYWTGVNERFHLKALPSFNEPSQSGIERLDRVVISRRADPGVFVANRANLPQRGSLTVRATFHAVSETLPPRIL